MTEHPVAADRDRPPGIAPRARREGRASPVPRGRPRGQARDRTAPGPEERVGRAVRESFRIRKRLVRGGQTPRARYEQDRFLKSWHGKVAALLTVNRGYRAADRRPAEEILRLADGLDLYRPSTDHGLLRLEPKPDGGHRPITSFSFRDKARQLLARWALRPFAEGHPSQYLLRGGTNAAVEAAKSAITDGCKWAVIADIRDCFGSFDVERVADLLPLPRRVTRSVVLSEGYPWRREGAEGVSASLLTRGVGGKAGAAFRRDPRSPPT